MIIGFLVNPIAGMGGSVGLKGTDGEDSWKEALRRGASRVSPARASTAMTSVRMKGFEANWLTCAGEMGKNVLDANNLPSRVVCGSPGASSRRDTLTAVKRFIEKGVDLVVFAGGDGTAVDVLEAADKKVPIIGIPAGV